MKYIGKIIVKIKKIIDLGYLDSPDKSGLLLESEYINKR